MKKVLVVLSLLAVSVSGCGSPVAVSSKADSVAPTAAGVHDTPVKVPGMPGLKLAFGRFALAANGCNIDAAYIVDVSSPELSILQGNGRTLHLTPGSGGQSGVSVAEALCILGALGIPISVGGRIAQTTEMMGPQTYSWDGIDATWTYSQATGYDFTLVDQSGIAADSQRSQSVTPEATPSAKAPVARAGDNTASNTNLVSFLVGGTDLGGIPTYVTCMTNLVDDVVVAMSASDDTASFRRQAGGVDTPRYKRGLALMVNLIQLHNLTKPAANSVSPAVVRQWILHADGPALYDGCTPG